MRAVIIDDEEVSLEIDATIIEATELFSSVKAFGHVDELLEYLSQEKVDVAFLDIIMDEADGISLAMEVKRIQPDCKIIFVSGSRDYAMEAFQVYASGYLLKPITAEEIDELMANING